MTLSAENRLFRRRLALGVGPDLAEANMERFAEAVRDAAEEMDSRRFANLALVHGCLAFKFDRASSLGLWADTWEAIKRHAPLNPPASLEAIDDRLGELNALLTEIGWVEAPVMPDRVGFIHFSWLSHMLERARRRRPSGGILAHPSWSAHATPMGHTPGAVN